MAPEDADSTLMTTTSQIRPSVPLFLVPPAAASPGCARALVRALNMLEGTVVVKHASGCHAVVKGAWEGCIVVEHILENQVH